VKKFSQNLNKCKKTNYSLSIPSDYNVSKYYLATYSDSSFESKLNKISD
jgi:hypothetical protein